MALFGRKKKNDVSSPEKEEEKEKNLDETQEESAEEESEQSPEISPEERFKRDCMNISKKLRYMFPQQMLIGFYYAELQSGGYIDDFCCYAVDGRLIEKADIPKLCGMSLPDMVSREEKLEKAFMAVHESSPAATGNPCNAISIMMLNNGQIKMDVTSGELAEGEEEIRYAEWRKKVEKANPRYMPPKVSEEKLKTIQDKTAELYKELGTEFYSFLPGEDFKIAYFYAENGENGIFYYHRLITADGEFIDGDELFEKFDMDKEEAAKNRVAIVQLIMQIMQVFKDFGEKPFTGITLAVTGKGEFQSHLSYGPTDAAGEQARLEDWKKLYNGEEEVK
jgi:hypothetical protein